MYNFETASEGFSLIIGLYSMIDFLQVDEVTFLLNGVQDPIKGCSS